MTWDVSHRGGGGDNVLKSVHFGSIVTTLSTIRLFWCIYHAKAVYHAVMYVPQLVIAKQIDLLLLNLNMRIFIFFHR